MTYNTIVVTLTSWVSGGHLSYIPRDSQNETTNTMLCNREEALKFLKFHLKRSKERMKQIADKIRSEDFRH